MAERPLLPALPNRADLLIGAVLLIGGLSAITACRSSKPRLGEPQEIPAAPKAPLSTKPDSAVIANYCTPGPAAPSLTAMKDSSGHIGGYIFNRAILDSPVFYLDHQGRQVAMFHIFGSPEEKRQNEPIIEALRTAFPVEEPIPCDPHY